MAYDARKKEVLEELDKAGFDAPAKDAITRVIDSYFSQREGRLENLLELLEPGNDPCHGKWIDKAKESAATAQDALGRSEHGKLWLAKISNEEHTFFFKLMISQVPVKRDLMVKQTLDLAKAEKEFEEKWKVILSSDQTIEEQMKKTALAYEEILNSAAKEAAKAEKEAREALADRVKRSVSAALKLVDLGVTEQIIKGATRLISSKLSEAEARKLEIHALISREEGIFGTFKEARGLVSEFLEDTSYPRVKDAWDQAEDAAEALAGAMLTNGQKDDCNAYCNAIKNELSNVFRKAEDAFKAFAKKHEYLFFGPLGGSYYQELMEDDFWKERSKNWQESKSDIHELLIERNLLAGDDKVLEVSLTGLTEEDKKAVHEALRDALQDLLRAWNQFKDVCKEPEWALESREQLKSILDTFR